MKLRTCVSPEGHFQFAVHKPHYSVPNLRLRDYPDVLGIAPNGDPIDNRANFPTGEVKVPEADWIFEIPNPFPFRGTTYICKSWADAKVATPSSISLPQPPTVSFTQTVADWFSGQADPQELHRCFSTLPEPLLLALATCSTDPEDLQVLADLSCEIEYEAKAKPKGLRFHLDDQQRLRPVFRNKALFEALVNNPALPDQYKEAMVLRPGVQGRSEIVGECGDAEARSHVFEYLRRNSYIPHGHYAANMANDCVRYSIDALSVKDLACMRHLYYQRTFVRLAGQLGLDLPAPGNLDEEALEVLRRQILAHFRSAPAEEYNFSATLWGWNYGFDYSPSHYRLHASHQQIHQQFAMVPDRVAANEHSPGLASSYSCGDLVADFIREYRRETGQPFFDTYLKAILTNSRLDGDAEKDSSLIIFEDPHVLLFVPKAQTSQWELQLMTIKPVGNIVEADRPTRQSLDRAIHLAMRTLTLLGARMITTIEFSKRFNVKDDDQRLLYSFLPKLPESMGAFSEAQLRFINGHYPEDFAAVCRGVCTDITMA